MAATIVLLYEEPLAQICVINGINVLKVALVATSPYKEHNAKMILSDILVLVASLTYFAFYAFQEVEDDDAKLEEMMVFKLGWLCCGAAATILVVHAVYLLSGWVSAAATWLEATCCPRPG